MSVEIRQRRGSTSEHDSFTGAEGEVTVDTEKKVAVVHDGLTPGGHPVASEDDLTSLRAARFFFAQL